jgi:hypothetical protein
MKGEKAGNLNIFKFYPFGNHPKGFGPLEMPGN